MREKVQLRGGEFVEEAKKKDLQMEGSSPVNGEGKPGRVRLVQEQLGLSGSSQGPKSGFLGADGANDFSQTIIISRASSTRVAMARLLHSLRRVLGLTTSSTTAAGGPRARSIDTDFTIFRGARRSLTRVCDKKDRADRTRRGRSGCAAPETAAIDEAIEEGRQDTSAPRIRRS